MTDTSPGPSSARRYRILLVEPDDTTAARVTGELLRLDHVAHVQRAVNRDEALRALLDEGPFDAALLDIDGTNGPDLDLVSAAAIHAPDTALVACSTNAGTDGQDSACLRAGASDFLRSADLSERVLDRVIRFGIDRKFFERHLRELVATDDLTGVGNRRALQQWFRASVNKLERHGGQLVIAVIDLDGFKAVNDECGHLAGDAVLQEVAHRLRDAFRPDDAAIRLGGDEFALVLHVPDPSAQPSVRQRACEILLHPPIVATGERVVTATVGVASTTDPTANLETLLAAADLDMYRRKDR